MTFIKTESPGQTQCQQPREYWEDLALFTLIRCKAYVDGIISFLLNNSVNIVLY